MKLYQHQLKALGMMHKGCILNGGVGTGKSLTAISYYYIQNGGSYKFLKGGDYVRMKKPRDLYIITTAKKRDDCDWWEEMRPFMMCPDPSVNTYTNKIVIDSWNNVFKYADVKDAFFIFDEQRVVGYGTWAKSFIKIAKVNEWILLSATPGDTWSDYMAVFIANGFYKHKKDFTEQHVIYDPFVKFARISGYVGVRKLETLRNMILVDMEYERKTVPHHETIITEYNRDIYKQIFKDRWNPWTDKPIEQAGEACQCLQKVANADESRAVNVLEILEDHPKAIIFYNYDYELEILKSLGYQEGTVVAEWNGHKHQPVPDTDKWVYLVQYRAGCEGWNCITTDCMIFYSQTYSYKVLAQACGRIDRLNTPFVDLYYYHLRSNSRIDISIRQALKNKKQFNERKFVKW